MKVNIDLRGAFFHSGIANYQRNLATRLHSYSDVDLIGCYNYSRAASKEKYKWFDGTIKRSYIPETIVIRHHIPFISYENMMMSSADVNLFLTYRLPLVKFDAPVISTIHDIIVLKTDCESTSFKNEHEQILRNTIKNSTYLLTVSKASKKDLVEYFNINPDNIGIVHNGINHEQFEEVLTDIRKSELYSKYTLPENFILYFGGYRAHKNIENLLRAYATLPQNVKTDLKLVVTNKNEILIKLANELGIGDDCVFTGFVDEQDKCAIYKAAAMTYYCSLYEGFGVPIIESQICKTPVISSNISSLPEAAGGGATLVDPYSIEEIREAIMKLYTDNAYKQSVKELGFLNAKRYTWEKGAKELHDFFVNKF